MITSARHRFILLNTTAYLVVALAWIFLSDRLLANLVDMQSVFWLSTAKGVFFVLSTAVLFFFALRAVPPLTYAANSPLLSDTLERPGTHHSRWLIYVAAVVLALVALVVRQQLAADYDGRPLLILCMLPIILSATLGGLAPGLLATGISVLGVGYLAFAPDHSLRITAPLDLFQWSLLVINGVAVSVLSELLRRSQSRLEANRRLLGAVVSGTSDAVYVKDRLGRYLLANPAAANFAGKPISDILGKDDTSLFSADTAQDLMRKDQAIMAAGQAQTHEEQITVQDGQTLVFLVTKGPVFDEAGKVTGLFGISREITERKQAEEAIKNSEAVMKAAQRLAAVGNWEWNIQTGEHTWSEEIYRIYGRNPSLPPAVYPEVQQYFTAQSWARLAAAVEQCIESHSPYECDAQVIRPDGSQRWITAHGQPTFDSSGQLLTLFGTVQDITERKLIAEQLQINQERLQLALEAASEGLWDWNIATGEVYRSDSYYQITGLSAADDSHDFAFFQRTIHPDDLAQAIAAIDAHRQGHTAAIAFEYRLRQPLPQIRWVQVKGRAVSRDDSGAALRMVGTIADITERKRIEDDLRLVLNEAGDAIWITDARGHFLFANPAACALTGHSLEHLHAMQVRDLLAASHLDELTAHIEQLQTEPYIRREWLLKRHDNSEINVELTTERMQDGRYVAFGRDLTERTTAAAALRNRERQLARVIEGSDQGYWDWNLQTNTCQVSARWEQMLGYQPGEMEVSPQNWAAHVQPDDLALALQSIERHLAGEIPSHELELRVRHKNGTWRWILTRGKVVEWDADGHPMIMSGTHTDITERKDLELSQREANTVFQSSYEGIMVVNPDKRISRVNPAFTRITGYTQDEVAGQLPSILSSGRHDKAFYHEMWNSVKEHDFWRGEIWNRRKNGELYTELLSISVVRDAKGAIQHYIGSFSDISQIKAHEAELDRIAHYDPLTGSPNRRLLADRLAQSIIRAARSEKTLAVCFLDLDGFKAINDQYGHATGDQLLVGVTENLKHVLRAEDTLARLGGDEFVVLLSDLDSPEECSLVLDRVLNAVSTPIPIDNFTVSVSASIGVSLYPDDNADADTLLRHADQAMYLAKEAGKNRFHLFDPENDRKAQLHRQYLEELRSALAHDEFVLYYQPKVDLLSGEIVGVEALIRWLQPGHGLVPPAEFLPHIYNTELEIPLGEWVIANALRQAAAWNACGMSLTVSVNVSANHLLQPGFYQYLQASLEQHPEFPPAHFELEVLETAAIEDMEQAVAILHHCRELGVHFALDDFGTGYSSLTYLRKLPVDVLKIDQSFVRDMLVNPDDLGIVEGVIRMASVFNRQVIAEGVETAEHGVALRNLGCRLAQGYGIAKPMPAEQFLKWAADWRLAPRI